MWRSSSAQGRPWLRLHHHPSLSGRRFNTPSCTTILPCASVQGGGKGANVAWLQSEGTTVGNNVPPTVGNHHHHDPSPPSWMQALVSAAAAVVTGGGIAAITLCEEAAVVTKDMEVTTTTTLNRDNKELQETPTRTLRLAHPGIVAVLEEDVDALVNEILLDRTINIAIVPDAIERRIYKSTIQLTLNFVYRLLFRLDGLGLLAHEIRLIRNSNSGSVSDTTTVTATIELDNNSTNNVRAPTATSATTTARPRMEINNAVLEQVADRLLQNRAINSSLVPDLVERKIYINCLKVFFRALEAITSTIRVTLCGHELRLLLEPSSSSLEQAMIQAADKSKTFNKNFSQIDLDKLRDFALESGVVEDADRDLLNNLSWWDSWWLKREFVTHLHVSLYGLLLGIVDDFLANTQIDILSEQLRLDIVPARATIVPSTDGNPHEHTSSSGDSSVGSFAAASQELVLAWPLWHWLLQNGEKDFGQNPT
jgi:hypothetical protein